MTPAATIIADAGPSVGLGHLSRAGALARALACHGVAARTLVTGTGEEVVRDGLRWAPAGDLAGVEPDPIVVVDSYRADRALLERWAESGELVCFHDGQGEPPAGARHVVSVGEERDGWLGSPRHACLRPAFWGLPARAAPGAVRRVLVTTGGGVSDRTGKLALRIREALGDAEVAMVRGPYAAEDEVPAGVTAVDAPPTLLGELLAADLVVATAGQVMLEALACGTPCVALALFDNQRAQLASLEALGAVLASDPADPAGDIAALAADAPGRAAMARRAQEVVDGYGALRVAWRIAEGR